MSNIDQVKKEIQQILDESGLQYGYDISFPIYNIIPDEVKLAYSILLKHGMTVSVVLKPKEKSPGQ